MSRPRAAGPGPVTVTVTGGTTPPLAKTNVYQDQGKYEEALVELKKGLDVLVSDHPDLSEPSQAQADR